jgi:quercetin dioxygenase-like cupin family protein
MGREQNKSNGVFKITGNWSIQATRLKDKFSQLTDDDLKFEIGEEEALLKRLEARLNKKRDELIHLIQLEDYEFEKAKAFIIVEIIEYIPNSVVIKTIIKKTTGNITAVSFDSGESLTERTSPFDTFIQVIDGKAEIIIHGVSNMLNTGQSIIIPAHASNSIKANVRFKMLSTIIKSGYEEVS